LTLSLAAAWAVEVCVEQQVIPEVRVVLQLGMVAGRGAPWSVDLSRLRTVPKPARAGIDVSELVKAAALDDRPRREVNDADLPGDGDRAGPGRRERRFAARRRDVMEMMARWLAIMLRPVDGLTGRWQPVVSRFGYRPPDLERCAA
jgi:hypothetical protein